MKLSLIVMGDAKRPEKTVASCLWLPEEISKVSENNFDHVIRVMFGFSTKEYNTNLVTPQMMEGSITHTNELLYGNSL